MKTLRGWAGPAGAVGRAGRSRLRPAVTGLERRTLLSGLAFRFSLDDPNHEFDAYPLLTTDLNAAGQILANLVDGRGVMDVRVQADDAIPRADGTAVSSSFVRDQGSLHVVENSTMTEGR